MLSIFRDAIFGDERLTFYVAPLPIVHVQRNYFLSGESGSQAAANRLESCSSSHVQWLLCLS